MYDPETDELKFERRNSVLIVARADDASLATYVKDLQIVGLSPDNLPQSLLFDTETQSMVQDLPQPRNFNPLSGHICIGTDEKLPVYFTDSILSAKSGLPREGLQLSEPRI